MNNTDKQTVKGIFIAIISTIVIMLFAFYFMCNFSITVKANSNINNNVANTLTKTQTTTDNHIIKLKQEIITEIDSYMDLIAPKNKVNSIMLFELCDEYSIDVRFAMAQAQIESHFGTCGTAAKTNSMFNVGAFDGHSAAKQKCNGYGYDTVNDSIEPYLKLLKKNYLVNGKTINHLMINYVNKYGMRYASSTQYEKMLRGVYNRINKTTKLDILLKEYNKYKHIV